MNNKELKKAGLRITTPRIKIFDILTNANQKHLSAEDIYKILQESNQNVSLATVYRVLSQFEMAGLIHKHQFEEGHAVFEISTEEHHDHLICTACGKVAEFYEPIIEEKQAEIAKQFGFTLTSHSLHIFGICSKCQQGAHT